MTGGESCSRRSTDVRSACIPCRKRKVRCDLGSVDNPRDPPCVRCRREAKECYFSATRRKKKNAGDNGSFGEADQEAYDIKNGRKRLRASQSVEVDNDVFDEADIYDEPRTPGGSIGRSKPLRRPQPQKPRDYSTEEHQTANETTAMLQKQEVHGGHDALKVLYEATQHVHNRSISASQLPRPTFSPSSSLPPATSPIVDRMQPKGGNMQQDDEARPSNGTNTSPNSVYATLKTKDDYEAYNSALKAWSRFRFVRAGWFTAVEGIDYVVYFYKYLSPLTPVCLPDFKRLDAHEKMLTEEPMLTVTILLIASRHMRIDGPGATSRPYFIHEKLTKYIFGMVNRLVWGQEQFGGGFCGAGAVHITDGAVPAADVNPLTRKGLRTLGTIESLVLLTEWHPRAMHFPPDEADEELMVPDHPVATPNVFDPADHKGIGGQRMDAWLEPCWRSDRLCWMLLGIAMSLAFEIGVFDESDWERHAHQMNGEPLSATDLRVYDKRRGNVRDIMLIYVTQTSGRLGVTSMLPATYSKPEDSPTIRKPLAQHESIRDTVLYFWLGMAHLIREGNQKIFANKAYTRDLIKNGNYKAALDQLQVPLLQWREEFDKASGIPTHMRHILQIEYEYCRVYVNALALQAVAERCANEPPVQILEGPLDVAKTGSVVRNDAAAIEPQTLAKWLGGDRKYFLAVREAATNLLKIVVNGLYPGEYLKHAPVRTYFRIICVAIMLLKSFSLGATESDVADSFILMDKTVEALKTCIVDDVHVASRFAELLNKLTESLKPRLIRISADGRSAGRSRGVSNHNTPAPGPSMPTQLNTANQKLQQAVQQQQHHRSHSQQAMAGASGMHNSGMRQQQWSYNNNNNNNHHHINNHYNGGGGYMPHSNRSSVPPTTNPLFGVTNQTYDFGDNEYSVMPPPSFSYQASPSTTTATSMPPNSASMGYDSFNPGAWGNDSGAGGMSMADDWLTLPLDAVIGAPGEVDNGMFGPTIGGTDMLELLLQQGSGQGCGM
jgi:hypothetical protein